MLYLEIVEVEKLKDKKEGKRGLPSKNPISQSPQPFPFWIKPFQVSTLKKKFDTQPLLTPTSKINKNHLIINQPTHPPTHPTNQPTNHQKRHPKISCLKIWSKAWSLVLFKRNSKMPPSLGGWTLGGTPMMLCVFSWEELMVPIKNLGVYIYMCYVC